MRRITDILDRLGATPNTPDWDQVMAAYIFSARCHSGQVRKSGEPYLMHPLEVAYILADLEMDADSVACGLLHDTVEDTHATLEEIADQFGAPVARLVDGVTKISRIEFTTAAEKAADNFRKMVVAMTEDLRVLIVKLCDRLHNMQTLTHMPEHKQQRIAKETLDIYAPLADRIGMNKVKTSLQDLSFRYLEPMAFAELERELSNRLPARQAYVNETVEQIRSHLDAEQLNIIDIYGRAKHLYSVWMKMQNKGVGLEQVYDAVAFRVIVPDVGSCYATLGQVHALWRPIPGRFKDFIALPKQNNYQSLHTTVVGPSGNLIEIQIRTPEMDLLAERGLAAHWRYKSDGSEGTKDGYDWLNQLMEWQNTVRDPNEFMESVKQELFHEEVFVFTPMGQVIQLPTNASCVDFAYSVHTEVGDRCSGAKVNGRMVPLRTQLTSGDRIEILTDKNRVPNREWLEFVVTSKARNKIRLAVRKREREQAYQVGRNLLDRALRANGTTLDKMIDKDDLAELAQRMKQHSTQDLIAAIGLNRIRTDTVVARLMPDEATLPPSAIAAEPVGLAQRLFGRKSKRTGKGGSGIVVGGLDDVMITLANCCSPLPGEQIVGYVSQGRGVRIHRLDCTELSSADPMRQVEVHWREDDNTLHGVTLTVSTDDKPGILANISATFEKLGINLSEANCRVHDDGSATHTFRFGVRDLDGLKGTIIKLRGLKGVLRVDRSG
jgi:GTP diphosphokinase / guanosine-3',5'-bis(diphosphate) 3'-diphosphatase